MATLDRAFKQEAEGLVQAISEANFWQSKRAGLEEQIQVNSKGEIQYRNEWVKWSLTPVINSKEGIIAYQLHDSSCTNVKPKINKDFFVFETKGADLEQIISCLKDSMACMMLVRDADLFMKAGKQRTTRVSLGGKLLYEFF